MTFIRKSGGTNITPTPKRRLSGAWVNVGFVKRRLSGAWVTVWTSIRVVINDRTVTRNSTSSSSHPTAYWTINSDGTVHYPSSVNGTDTVGETWLQSGVNSDYQVRATVTAGAVNSGTTGSWLALSTTRTWSVTPSSYGGADATATLTIEIRDAVTLAVLETATITLSSSWGPV